ncbi:hypothetical protein [Microseira wollei]|uniref:hypothetical protein n=1 Tax=Microseira wollei TaxID=467598 RepID=UPI001CFC5FF5|nr:hypothetical protein [Microseira wollei]
MAKFEWDFSESVCIIISVNRATFILTYMNFGCIVRAVSIGCNTVDCRGTASETFELRGLPMDAVPLPWGPKPLS